MTPEEIKLLKEREKLQEDYEKDLKIANCMRRGRQILSNDVLLEVLAHSGKNIVDLGNEAAHPSYSEGKDLEMPGSKWSLALARAPTELSKDVTKAPASLDQLLRYNPK